MARPVCITADSTCDLSPELLERFGIKIIPLTVRLGAESYPDDGRSVTPERLYEHIRGGGAMPQTAAPNVQDFLDFFTPLVEAGYEIVHLDISAELSGSCQNAALAAREFPGGVHVVDSRMLSTGVGLLAIEGAERAAEGMAAAEIAEHLRGLTGKVETSFVLDTLDFMRRGGRCSNFAALGANLLQLKPALEMAEGKLGVYKKYRGNIEHVYRQYVSERLEGKKIRPGHVFLTESGGVDGETIKALAALVREMTGAREVHHTRAGCTVATHCGPKTLGVLFIDE